MKIGKVLGMLAVGLALVASHPQRVGAVTIAADIEFYDALSPYGSWESVGGYGDCWVPYHHARSWRPYTVGYWVDTDYGWMWISQDPWGDIPYHYGRWAWDSYYGWVWVPDDDLVWAPAWVSWRYGGDYVGWAPLPPEADWGGSGLSLSISFVDQRIPRSGWCFTPTRYFGTSSIRYNILPTTQNTVIYSRTRNVTRYTTYNSLPAVRGPQPEVIQRVTGRSIPRYHIADTGSRGLMKRSAVRGRTIQVYRPTITGVRQRRAQFVPTGRRGRETMERRGGTREQIRGRDIREERTRRERGVSQTRQNEIRRQQQAEIRARQRDEQRQRGYEQRQQQRGYERRQQREQGQGGGGQGSPPQYRERGRGQDQGQGQGQREYRERGQGQGGNRGQGQQPQQQERRGRGQGRGQNQDKGNGGDDKDQGQGQGQGKGKGHDDQDGDRGHGRGHNR